jgi:hypothetical protein
MRLPSMAVFRMAGAAVMAMSFARLARLMKLTSHGAVAVEAPDVNRVAELADQLAARILAAIESGELTAEEFRNSREGRKGSASAPDGGKPDEIDPAPKDFT